MEMFSCLIGNNLIRRYLLICFALIVAPQWSTDLRAAETPAESPAESSVEEQGIVQVIKQAETLHNSGWPMQAYELLHNHADDYAGSLEFDYLLGKIALDAGLPLQAIFALERVLDQQPDLAPARAELAKAYYLIGENEAAKAEFKQAKKADMPEQSKQLIDRYLSTIDERILGGVTDTSFYILTGLGYDSNINGAASTSQVALPTGILTFAPEADSSVGLVQGGGRFSHALKDNINLYGSADLRFYETFEEKDFATQTADGTIGLHFMHGLNQYRLSLVGQIFALDGSANRNLLGMNGQWQRTIDAANQFTLFGQYASLRFPDAEIRDVNQLSVGATWLHLFANPYQPVTYFTGYYGTEAEQTDLPNTDFIGRDYFGIRAGVRVKTSARMLWSGVLSYQKSEYGGVDPFFNETRKDNFVNIVAGLDYLLSSDWSIRPELTYSKNDSTLVITTYDRLRFMVSARKEF